MPAWPGCCPRRTCLRRLARIERPSPMRGVCAGFLRRTVLRADASSRRTSVATAPGLLDPPNVHHAVCEDVWPLLIKPGDEPLNPRQGDRLSRVSGAETYIGRSLGGPVILACDVHVWLSFGWFPCGTSAGPGLTEAGPGLTGDTGRGPAADTPSRDPGLFDEH